MRTCFHSTTTRQRLQATVAGLALISLSNALTAAAPCERRVWDRHLPPPQVEDGWFYDSTVWDDGSGNGPVLYGVGFFAVPDGAGWADGVARWNGTTWEAVGHGVGYTTHTGYPEVHATIV